MHNSYKCSLCESKIENYILPPPEMEARNLGNERVEEVLPTSPLRSDE